MTKVIVVHVVLIPVAGIEQNTMVFLYIYYFSKYL